MASATPPPQDLTLCGICKDIISSPKALSCLHTFCLECLREWSQHDEETITCPVLSCKKTTTMPSEGVNALPGNVFVASLIENSPTRSKKVPCVCCEEKDNVVVAKCLDCNGFLCQEGVDVHKKPFLKTHQVIKLEDVKSGKVNLQKLGSKKQHTCSKHKGQPLWFFCETCEVLICRDCTVVNHKDPEHKYVELECVVSEHKKKLEELMESNGAIKGEVEKRIQETKETRKAIGVQMKKVNFDIEQAMEKIKADIDALCRMEKERLIKERADFETAAYKELTAAEENLTKQRETLQTALQMANQVLQSGSDYDIASVFKQISAVLTTNSQIHPVELSCDVTDPPTFFASSQVNTLKNIGNLRRKKLPFSSCVLEGRFGESDAEKEPGKLELVRGIAATVDGDIAIANESSVTPVKVYNIHGKFKFCLDQQSTNAQDVATSSNGQFFVTSKNCRMVNVFDLKGKFKFQFQTILPDGVLSTAVNTALGGITVNNINNQVYVGEKMMKYISIHDLNGSHYRSIRLSIAPHYVASTQQGRIIVSPNETQQGVQILDGSGSVLHTVNAPESVSLWYPVGICCNSNDDIFVSNRGDPVGIYRFSSSGNYLGCVNKNTAYEYMCGGLTFSQDEEKLLVAEGDCYMKIFRRDN